LSKNLGDVDRTVRILLGAPLGVIFFKYRNAGTPGLVLGVVVLFLLATCVLGWDPLYAVLRKSTRGPQDADVKRR
jgi:Protein of unknown function (DUF2892)